jgi:hypothetical protein
MLRGQRKQDAFGLVNLEKRKAGIASFFITKFGYKKTDTKSVFSSL